MTSSCIANRHKNIVCRIDKYKNICANQTRKGDKIARTQDRNFFLCKIELQRKIVHLADLVIFPTLSDILVTKIYV